MCEEADYVMVKTFCCFWLQYGVWECYWLLPYLCDTHLQIEYTVFWNWIYQEENLVTKVKGKIYPTKCHEGREGE